MAWPREWYEAAKEVVFSPDAFFQEAPQEDARYALTFAATSFLVLGVLQAVVRVALTPLLGGTVEPTALVLQAVLAPLGVVGLAIMAAIIHVFVYLLGGRGYDRTLAVLSYTTAVTAFFGWIPVVNIFAGLYAIYLQIRGVSAFHGFSMGRAAVAVLALPLILLLLVILAAGGTLLTTFMVQQETTQAASGAGQQLACAGKLVDIVEVRHDTGAGRVTVVVTNSGQGSVQEAQVRLRRGGSEVGVTTVGPLAPGDITRAELSYSGSQPDTVVVQSTQCPSVTAQARVQ